MLSKSQLFNIYSENLNLVSRSLFNDKSCKGQYLCPICLKIFLLEHLQSNHKLYLTEEHVPPKSVTWKRKVLTCNSCNTKQGGMFDSHLPIAFKAKAFLRKEPRVELDTNFTINNEIKSAGTTAITEEGGYKIQFDPKRTSPKGNELIKELLKEGNRTPNINVKFKAGNPKNAIVSIIRSAYLWAFSELGYAFVFNPNLNSYRQLILNQSDPEDHLKKVIKAKFPDNAKGVNIITKPENYGCYLVLIEPKVSGYSEKLGVLLPGNMSSGFELINHVIKGVGNKCSTWECQDLNNSNILNNQELCIFPYMYWKKKYKLKSSSQPDNK